MLLSTAGCQLNVELDEKKVEVFSLSCILTCRSYSLFGWSLNALYFLLEVPGSVFFLTSLALQLSAHSFEKLKTVKFVPTFKARYVWEMFIQE
jgi:hypothetical protein